MNTEEMPLTTLQTNTEDGMVVCRQADDKNSLQLDSDVNKNKLHGSTGHCLPKKEDTQLQSKDAQDNINNNEALNMMCGQLSCKKGCEDNCTVMDSLATASFPNRDNATTKGKRVSGRRSNRNKRNFGKCIGLSTAVDVTFSEENVYVGSVHEQATPDFDACFENRTQRQLRDSLFSLIREGFESTDEFKMLPSCLHKIAETYFLEEEYEKAMEFIQLERVYHEQLLANLSAIQNQWETKWKTTKSTSSPSLQCSEQGLSSEEFERLSNICSSHQYPQVSKCKLSASEKSVSIQSHAHLLGTTATHYVDGAFIGGSERECEPDRRTATDRKLGGTVMTEDLSADVNTADLVSGGADNQVLSSQSHIEEQQMSVFGATVEIHTQPEATTDCTNPDSSFASGDTGMNNILLQTEATMSSSDVAEIETFSEEAVEERAASAMVDKLISVPTVHPDCVSEMQDDFTRGSSLECSSPEDIGAGDGVAVIRRVISANSTVSELKPTPDCTADQVCPEEGHSRAQHQTAVEFIASLLNGDLADSESFLAHLEFQEDTFSEEDMSPSPGESVLGDNFLSLDELAKKIEIEEVNPASGLVSILKKRISCEGDKTSQPLPKPATRKVRFEEAEDVLDQEEINGGSCILLIALCIATVFLSIGGTALYCTFGDMDSSVCKDFAANMDFYYIQALQGIDELRHWLFIT